MIEREAKKNDKFCRWNRNETRISRISLFSVAFTHTHTHTHTHNLPKKIVSANHSQYTFQLLSTLDGRRHYCLTRVDTQTLSHTIGIPKNVDEVGNVTTTTMTTTTTTTTTKQRGKSFSIIRNFMPLQWYGWLKLPTNSKIEKIKNKNGTNRSSGYSI